MEDFKDVMLSEVPVPSRPYGGYQPNMHSVGTFENYKGILLCDRPSENKILQTGPQPFLPPGAIEGGVGLQPSNEMKSRHADARGALTKNKKVTTVIHQQRKALRALNEKKIQEKLDAVEAAIEADERREKFQAKQAQLRHQIQSGAFKKEEPDEVIAALAPGADPDLIMGRSSARDSSRQSNIAALPPMPPPPVSHVRVRTPVDDDASSTRSKRSTPRNGGSKAKKSAPKPKWAMTEEEALDAELNETGDLVKFAENLDYEKYLDDYEIREALSIMQERVEELREEEAREKGVEYIPPHLRSADDEETYSVDGERRPVRRERATKPTRELLADMGDMAQREADWDNFSSYSNLSDRKKRLISEEAIRLAEKILANSSQMKGVHSKQSLARLLEEATHKNYNNDRAKAAPAPLDLGAPIPQPPVASYQASASAKDAPPRILTKLKNSTDYVQNLPYLYRCPSI
mmetsp:Transcript_27605/g.49751  ORF Transcript_27605/g.49751 Transcript_27605/m.49751 type:complete len:463 (-) Transcript_27605:1723-3111(-)